MHAIVKKFREPSTWAGLSALMMLLGLNVEQAGAIGQAGAAVAGVAAVFMSEGSGGA